MGRQDSRTTQTLVADSSMHHSVEIQSVELGLWLLVLVA